MRARRSFRLLAFRLLAFSASRAPARRCSPADTVWLVSVLQVHALFVGIPLLLVIILSALIWSHKGPHPATYKMSEPVDA